MYVGIKNPIVICLGSKNNNSLCDLFKSKFNYKHIHYSNINGNLKIWNDNKKQWVTKKSTRIILRKYFQWLPDFIQHQRNEDNTIDALMFIFQGYRLS